MTLTFLSQTCPLGGIIRLDRLTLQLRLADLKQHNHKIHKYSCKCILYPTTLTFKSKSPGDACSRLSVRNVIKCYDGSFAET